MNNHADTNGVEPIGDIEGTATKKESSKALRLLVEQHLPLVNHIVFQVAIHFPRHVDRDDLARAGALGLVEAAQRYDEARGVPFDRFAAQRIRGAIIDAVRAADWAPRSVRTLARRLDSVEQRLASELGRVPEVTEVAEALGMSKPELYRLQDRLFRSVVLAFDHLVSDDSDEEMTLVDILEDPSAVEPLAELENREMQSYLRDAIGLLPERQRMVVVGYFLEDKTSTELAALLGVTESRVSQMRTEALEALRRGIEAQYDDHEDPDARGGRLAKRRATFADAIGASSTWRNRLNERRTLVAS